MYQLTKTQEIPNEFYARLGEDERNSLKHFRKFREFSQEVADNINKDYPGSAIVKDNCCFVTDEYWEFCKNYVQANCKIKLDGYNLDGYNLARKNKSLN